MAVVQRIVALVLPSLSGGFTGDIMYEDVEMV
jgi:hypothetical protein